MGYRRLYQVERCTQIDRNRLLVIYGAHLVRVAHYDDAGNVAQSIETTELFDRSSNRAEAVVPGGKISCMNQNAPAEVAQLLCGLLQASGIQIHYAQVRAGPCERKRRCAPQP